MTADIRKEVQQFMSECERLFGFAHQNGGLTSEECLALAYYAHELTAQVSAFCETKASPQQ